MILNLMFSWLDASADLGPWALAQSAQDAQQFGMDFFELLRRGGVFMIPIGIMSLIVVTFLFERWIGLRASKLMPKRTVSLIRRVLKAPDFDKQELQLAS